MALHVDVQCIIVCMFASMALSNVVSVSGVTYWLLAVQFPAKPAVVLFWALCLAPRILYAQEKCSKCILKCHDDNLVMLRLQLCPTVSSCAKQQCCLRQ
jgi:hypothetical protein